MKVVFNKLEKWYGVEMHVNNITNTLLEDKFTGLFEKQDIGDVLQVLKEYYGFDYKIFGYDIYITPKNNNK